MSIATHTAGPPVLLSRMKMLLAMGIVLLASLLVLARESFTLVLAQLVTDGPLLLAWLGACWGIGSRITHVFGLAGGRFHRSSVILEIAAQVAFGIGIIALVVLILGSIGVLNQLVSFAMLALCNWPTLKFIYQQQADLKAWLKCGPLRSETPVVTVVRNEPTKVARDRRRHESALTQEVQSSAIHAWPLLLAMPVLAMVLVAALTLPGILWGDEPHPYDVLAYHLQLPREWFEGGKIAATPHNMYGYFPLNVEMHYLLAMTLRGGAARGMLLAQLMHASMMALTLAAVYGAVRRRLNEGSMLRAAVAVVLCAAIPWLMMLGSVAYNECGLMLFSMLAVVAAYDGRWIRAGLLAGFAAGCKITAVPALAGVLLLLMLVRHPRTWFGVPFIAAFFIVPALISFSPWLVRDAVLSGGNPVFPIAARSLGAGHFDAGMVERFEIAHAARADQQTIQGRVSALNEQVFRDFKYGSISVGAVGVPLLLILAAPALALGARDRTAWMGALFILGNLAIWLFATHLQGRFAVPIIPIAAILIASARHKAWTHFVLVLAVAIGLVAHRTVYERLQSTAARAGIAIDDPSVFLPEALTKLLLTSNRPVYLLGDARALLYPVPGGRLHYRSVFDVSSTKPFRQAWLGDSPAADAIVVVLPSELERFEKTYRNLPKMPDEWRGKPMFVTDVEFKSFRVVE